MCKLVFFVQATCYAASVALLTVISIERYAAIIHPLKSKQFTTVCVLRTVVVIIWLLSALTSIPMLAMYELTQLEPGKQYCLPMKTVNEEALELTTFILGYVIPIALMTWMYVRIGLVLWDSGTGLGLTSQSMSSKNSRTFKWSTSDSRENACNTKTSHVIGCALLDEKMPNAPLTTNDSAVVSGGQADMPLHCTCSDILKVSGRAANPVSSSQPSHERQTSNSLSKMRHDAIETRHLAAPDSNQHQIKHRDKTTPDRCSAVLLARRRIIRLLIAVIASFAVCVLPYHVIKLWLIYAQPATSYTIEILHALALLFYYLNNALNPILYEFLSTNFSRSLVELCHAREQRVCHPKRKLSFSVGHVSNTNL